MDECDTLRAFLRNTTCYDIMAESAKVLVLDVQIPLRLAFFVLVENSVSSAPLWDRSTDRNVGMFSPTEFVTILLHFYATRTIAKNLVTLTVDSWLRVRHEAVAGLRRGEGHVATDGAVATADGGGRKWEGGGESISTTMGVPTVSSTGKQKRRHRDGRDIDRNHAYDLLASHPDAFMSISVEASLYDACVHLRNYRIHRIPTVDPTENSSVLSVVTHLKVLSFVARHFRFRSSGAPSEEENSSSSTCVFDRSIESLDIGSFGNAVSIAKETTALRDVLRIIWHRRVSAVPIVSSDGSGRVVDLYSKSDVMFLCRIQQNYEEHLELPVSVELETLKKQGVRANQHHEGLNTCSVKDSLRSVVGTFVRRRAHRLIALDAQGRCVAIISLSDIFDWLLG
eukprot:g2353.t1